MKERPILFSGPMVRAILEGRKIQTRRVIKFKPGEHRIHKLTSTGSNEWLLERWPKCEREFGNFGRCDNLKCPYGAAGDRLWVKETWFPSPVGKFASNRKITKTRPAWASTILYRADGDEVIKPLRWKPSIFMPRWASRITLEIREVRVERLQEISARDCEYEGLIHGARAAWSCPGWEGDPFREGHLGYKWLWESINGKGSWDKNPFCWVITFKRV